jgi:hypothetical protein
MMTVTLNEMMMAEGGSVDDDGSSNSDGVWDDPQDIASGMGLWNQLVHWVESLDSLESEGLTEWLRIESESACVWRMWSDSVDVVGTV